MSAEPPSSEPAEPRVTSLELFFDLVFVFAITQVTTFWSEHLTWLGVLQGSLILAALWWAWAGYAWLTNAVNLDHGKVRLPFFAAMGAMLVASLAVPNAFDHSALLFGVAFVLVRAAHIAFFAAGASDSGMRRAVLLLLPGAALSGGLLLAAAYLRGTLQLSLWLAALLCDYLAPLVSGVRGWRVSTAHFVERHGLIVMIALGESIVSLGVGAAGHDLDAGEVTGVLLGLACASALWWLYFDVVVRAAERRLARAQGEERNRIARDAFSYLHLPIVAGVMFFALGVKKTLTQLGDPLPPIAALALGGGPALYLTALSLLRLRNFGALNRQRLVAAALAIAAGLLSLRVAALASLGALSGLLIGLVIFESSAARFRARRESLLRGEQLTRR
jgi:low temperature requirement protein LtrA